MVQPTTSQPDNKWGDYRVGVKHHDPDAVTPAPEPARAPLPPIQWSRIDHGRIVREDLLGIAKAIIVVLLSFTFLIGVTVGIASALAGVIHAVGFDPSSAY